MTITDIYRCTMPITTKQQQQQTMDKYFINVIEIIGTSYYNFTREEWLEKRHNNAMIQLNIKKYFKR